MSTPEDTAKPTPAKDNAGGILRIAALVCLAAFAFGFAMVPIYRLTCEHILGIKLAATSMDVSASDATAVDLSRTVTVQFVGTVNSRLPWEFAPVQTSISVHPGELIEVWYDATNTSGHDIVGNAVPSVAPANASAYFNKTECFCFTEQLLMAGEARRMPVRFIVDPRLPKKIRELTLSYTFFENDVATRRLGQSGVASQTTSS